MIGHYAERSPISMKPYPITRVKEMESEKGKEPKNWYRDSYSPMPSADGSLF